MDKYKGKVLESIRHQSRNTNGKHFPLSYLVSQNKVSSALFELRQLWSISKLY